MSTTIKEAWESLESMILQNAGPVQKKEMRRAFYAGAQAFLGILLNHLDDNNSDEVTEMDMSLMDSLHDELKQFAQDLQEGRV